MKLNHDIDPNIIKDRQQWFWRRITLQTTLLVLLGILTYKAGVQSMLKENWVDVTIIGFLLSAIIWLNTIYFAMVNDAAKISSVINTLGGAIGEARNGNKKENE
jgi:hypothetical protein